MSAIDPRFVRVILAADRATDPAYDDDPTDAWNDLCSACERITDEELDEFRTSPEQTNT